MEEDRGGVSTDRLCRIMNVSPRGFRAFRSRPMSQRQRTDMVLLAHIREQHKLSLGSYGRPRMTEELKELGFEVGHRRPSRGLQANPCRAVDRGSQYCSHDYQKLLRQHGFKASMSGKGNCYDNAAMEIFFKTIKAELIWRHSWQTRRDAEIAIFEYINGFYNPRRRHSALGWKSPFSWFVSQTTVRQCLAFERFAA